MSPTSGSRSVPKTLSPFKLGKIAFQSLWKHFAPELKGSAMEEFIQGFWAEYGTESTQITALPVSFKEDTLSKAKRRAPSFRTKLVLRDFAIRREWAQRYHKLEYVAKELASTQSGDPSKDLALLCCKLEELSLEDWECQSYGIEEICSDEMSSEEQRFGEARNVEASMLDEGADWVMLTEDDGTGSGH